jgi:hypothetical protein
MEAELNAFVASKAVSDTTKKNYRDQYERITRLTGKTIVDTGEVELLQAIQTLNPKNNPTSEWTLINLPLMIRRQHNKSIAIFEARRLILQPLMEQHNSKLKKDLHNTLPTKEQLTKFTEDLFNKKKYKEFITNWLILTYGVRNKDIDAFITTATDHKLMKDNTINYLIIKETQVEWIINEYKTLMTFGVKNIIIKNKQFIEAIRQLPLNNWLFHTKSKEHIKSGGLGTIIIRQLYENMSEADYFKVNMNWINTQHNTTELLERFSRTRGTSLANIMTYYDTTGRDEEEY